MTTDRAYRSALPFEVAIAELVACAGTQLDPKVVDVLLLVVRPSIAVPEASPVAA